MQCRTSLAVNVNEAINGRSEETVLSKVPLHERELIFQKFARKR